MGEDNLEYVEPRQLTRHQRICTLENVVLDNVDGEAQPQESTGYRLILRRWMSATGGAGGSQSQSGTLTCRERGVEVAVIPTFACSVGGLHLLSAFQPFAFKIWSGESICRSDRLNLHGYLSAFACLVDNGMSTLVCELGSMAMEGDVEVGFSATA